MGDFAHRFFKDEGFVIGDGSGEDGLLFFITNYSEFIEMYRVITAQLEKTKNKKERAHQQLQELRDRLEEMAKKKQELTEAQKIEIDARKEYLENLREEDDLVYFRGEPMEKNQVSHIIVKYQSLFYYVERLDRFGRSKISKVGKRFLKVAFKPMDFMTKSFLRDSTSSNNKKVVKEIRNIFRNLPNDLEEAIMRKIEVDLHDHIPRQKEFVWE